MTPQEELADYMATGMKDYQRGVSLFKNLGINASDNLYFKTDNPSKIQINLLKQKLSYYAKIKNIKPQRTIVMPAPVEKIPERPDIPLSELHDSEAPVELDPEHSDIPVTELKNQNRKIRVEKLKTAILDIISKIERKFNP